MRTPLSPLVFALTLVAGFAVAGEPPSMESLARTQAAPLLTKLRAFHQGARPCLRYDPPHELDATAADVVGRQLAKAGVRSDDVRGLVPLFFAWSAEDEARAHALSEPDEYRRALEELMTPEQRSAVAKDPAALNKTIAALTTSPRLDAAAARAAFDRMPKGAQAAVKDAWRERPEALRFGFMDVLASVRREETRKRLQEVAAAVSGHFKAHGRFPDKAAVEKTLGPLVDAAGSPLTYVLGANEVTLGADALQQSDWLRIGPSGIGSAEPASCRNETSVRIPRAAIATGAGPPELGARLAPAFDSAGTASGFKIFSIQPNALGARLGFCEGDVLVSANGERMDRPDKLMKAFDLKDRKSVSYGVLRAGKALDLRVAIDDSAMH